MNHWDDTHWMENVMTIKTTFETTKSQDFTTTFLLTIWNTSTLQEINYFDVVTDNSLQTSFRAYHYSFVFEIFVMHRHQIETTVTLELSCSECCHLHFMHSDNNIKRLRDVTCAFDSAFKRLLYSASIDLTIWKQCSRIFCTCVRLWRFSHFRGFMPSCHHYCFFLLILTAL